MTNINCSADCVYQKDGICTFENLSPQKITSTSDCAYFIQSKSGKN